MIGRLSEIASHYRSQLRQREDQSGQQLTNAHARTLQEIQPQLDQVYRDVTTKLREVSTDQEPPAIPLSWLREGNRLENLKTFIMVQVGQFATFAQGIVGQVQQWVASLGKVAADLLMKIASPGLQLEMPPPSNLLDYLKSVGGKAAGLLHSFGRNAAKGIEEAFVIGLATGSDVSDLAAKVTQVLDEPRWRSLAILSDQLFRVYNTIVLGHYRANADVFTGWIWHCKLTSRSCIACVALHGTIHPMSETLYDHVRGECSAIPYREGMELPLSGVDWFREQSEQTQRDILGTDVAYKLFQSGMLLDKFVGVRDHEEWGRSVYQKSAKQITGRG